MNYYYNYYKIPEPQGKISRYKPEKTVEKVQNDMNLIFFAQETRSYH